MLLASFVRAARRAALTAEGARSHGKTRARPDLEMVVAGPQPMLPAEVATGRRTPLREAAFLAHASRLRRDEILHSMIGAERFPVTGDPHEKRTLPRVQREHGYSGPLKGSPTLDTRYGASGAGRIVTISDTGNQFRYEKTRWPVAMLEGATRIVHKLHRPLPDKNRPNDLWNLVKAASRGDHVVVLDIEDLRAEEIPISQGLSWERTATDLVWQLLNVERLSELRDCPMLVVRIGLDGALLWRPVTESGPRFRAWLVYDPGGIEGAFAASVPGRMVGYGSAFTAALVESLAEEIVRPTGVDQQEHAPESALIAGIKTGLLAARRLLTTGFEVMAEERGLRYPGPSLFVAPDKADARFAHQAMPIIPGAVQPDRGYWRLLESIFEGTGRLHEAVELVATRRKGTDTLQRAQELLDASPRATFGNLTTFDRRETEHYRSLYALLRDYLRAPSPARPLSVAVFGAPGAGKSFGVKEVARSLKGQPGCRDIEPLTFNLSLYQSPEDLAGAFHLVRDVVLRGKVPLVFFDEFDTSLGGAPLGWLRHFLAPMQDGEFLDRAVPHPIGPAIFVFAGGTCSTFTRFEAPAGMTPEEFTAVKGPDFISRLRATLDIPSLNLAVAFDKDSSTNGDALGDQVARLLDARGLEHFDPYGPIEAIPSRAAVLLRRAGILAFNLPNKAPDVVRADKSLAISHTVLRALIHLPQFRHGNRSFEALLDMSRLVGATVYTPALLPPTFQTSLHADAMHLAQLVATDPFPEADRERIAEAIHAQYLEDNKTKPEPERTRAFRPWQELEPDDRAANLEQADDIAAKLRTAGLWFRKRSSTETSATDLSSAPAIESSLDVLAVLEHDRWAAQKRRQGWAAAHTIDRESRKDDLLLHNCLFPWQQLSEEWWRLDRNTVRQIPTYLLAAGYDVIQP